MNDRQTFQNVIKVMHPIKVTQRTSSQDFYKSIKVSSRTQVETMPDLVDNRRPMSHRRHTEHLGERESPHFHTQRDTNHNVLTRSSSMDPEAFKELKEKLISQKRQVESLKKVKSNLVHENKELHNQKKIFNEILIASKKKGKLQQKVFETEIMNQELLKENAMIHEIKNENLMMHHNYNKLIAEVIKSRQRNEEWADESNQLKEENKVLRKEYEEIIQVYESQIKEIEKFSAELNEAYDNNIRLKEEIIRLNSTLDKLKQACEYKDKEISQLKEKISSMDHVHSESLKEYKSSKSILEQEISRLQSLNNELTKINMNLTQSINENAQKISSLSIENSALIKSIDQQKDSLKEIFDLKREIQTLNAQIIIKNQEREKSIIEESQREKSKTQEFEKRIAQIEKEREQEREKFNKDIEALAKENQEKSKSMSSSNKDQLLQSEIGQLNKIIKELEDQNNFLTKEKSIKSNINLINEVFIQKLNSAKTIEEHILAEYELSKLIKPSQIELEQSKKMIEEWKEEISMSESKFFSKLEHVMLAFDDIAKKQGSELYFNDKINWTQFPSDLKYKVEVMIINTAMENIQDASSHSSLVKNSLSNTLNIDESNIITLEENKQKDCVRYSFFIKDDPYVTRISDMLEDSSKFHKAIEEKFLRPNIKKDEVKIYKEAFFEYLLINLNMFLAEAKTYSPNFIEPEKHPKKSKHEFDYFKPYGYDGYKVDIQKQYPQLKEELGNWIKVYYPLYTTASNLQNSREEIVHFPNSNKKILEREAKIFDFFFQYAAEAEKVSVLLKFDHRETKFHFKFLLMAKIDPKCIETNSPVEDPFCIEHSSDRGKIKIDHFFRAKVVNLLIKKVEENDCMNHNSDCYLCEHLSKTKIEKK